MDLDQILKDANLTDLMDELNESEKEELLKEIEELNESDL